MRQTSGAATWAAAFDRVVAETSALAGALRAGQQANLMCVQLEIHQGGWLIGFLRWSGVGVAFRYKVIAVGLAVGLIVCLCRRGRRYRKNGKNAPRQEKRSERPVPALP